MHKNARKWITPNETRGTQEDDLIDVQMAGCNDIDPVEWRLGALEICAFTLFVQEAETQVAIRLHSGQADSTTFGSKW